MTAMWFQQDGATCHTANATVDLLKTKFDEKIILKMDLAIGLRGLEI